MTLFFEGSVGVGQFPKENSCTAKLPNGENNRAGAFCYPGPVVLEQAVGHQIK